MPFSPLPSYALSLFLLASTPTLPKNYEANILNLRQEDAKELTAPDSWLSLVALQRLDAGDVTVGSAPGNTVRLEHGPAHAFTLHTAAGKVVLAAANPGVTLEGKPAPVGAQLTVSDDPAASLHWDKLRANVIERTGNEIYLRIGDPDSPNRRNFHGLTFYPVDPAYRITAKWVPYTTPHEITMGTVLGTSLKVPSPGYAEFTHNGQTVRLDAMENANELVMFSFRDGTAATTTYGAGRHVTTTERPTHGLKAPGEVVIDFNLAGNWPCAYTAYGTCPLPPKENRFTLPIPAGEKRYHD